MIFIRLIMIPFKMLNNFTILQAYKRSCIGLLIKTFTLLLVFIVNYGIASTKTVDNNSIKR